MTETRFPKSGRIERQVAHVRHHVEDAKHRYEGSAAESVWSRLDRVDFINRGMLFAAVLLLCFFPFIIVVNALAGRSAVTTFSRHLGLNKQAAADLSHAFASSSATSATLSGPSYVFFVLGGIAAAAAIQGLYEQVFDLRTRGMRDMPRRLVWLGALMAVSYVAGLLSLSLRHSGGPVVTGIVGFGVAFAFWLFTMWFLLAGRVPWRSLVPCAVATALFWLGMTVVFSLVSSNMIIGNYKKYGSIGVVFALMSWLIAIGVVIILGAVVGAVWRERELSVSAGARRLARRQGGTDPPGNGRSGP